MDLSGYQVLVVDDVRFTRLTLIRMLQGLGCAATHEAADGLEALDVLKRHPGIDCMITDLEMPNLDGLALLQAIRNGNAGIRSGLRVMILTGNADFERLGPALLLDIDGFLSKPTSRQELEHCFERVFGKQPPADAAATAAGTGGTGADGNTQPPAGLPGQPERCIPLAGLPVGAVLSRDLLFSNGRLLLPAGTQLKASVLDRLLELLPLTSVAADAWILGQ